MIRISTAWMQDSGINGVIRRQSTLMGIQEQIATGKKINRPSDDPVAASQIVTIKQELAAIVDYQTNANMANSKLEQEESTLNAINETIQLIRQKAIYANDGALGMVERNAIAAELKERLTQLYDLANTRDASGNYIFSGFLGNTPTVSKNASGQYSYQGDLGTRNTRIATLVDIEMNDNGRDLFFDLPAADLVLTSGADVGNVGTGAVSSFYVEKVPDSASANYVVTFNALNPGANFAIYDASDLLTPLTGYEAVDFVAGKTYSIKGLNFTLSGSPDPADTFTLTTTQKQDQNIFTTVQNLIDAVSNRTMVNERLSYNVGVALDNLDAAETKISTVRAEVGARLNVIDSALSTNSQHELLTRTVLSGLEDLDFAKAASNLELFSISLQAAQQSFLRIQSLSIFNYL